jgi:L-lactate dehydrogenase complex protein LldF
MANILLLEPASSGKRRTFSDSFIKKKRAGRPCMNKIKKRLREIRDDSLINQDTLINNLMDALNVASGVDISFAHDAQQAVKRIKEISGPGLLVTNKSAVVTMELVPHLKTAGNPVIASYDGEFKSFDNRFKAYWQLPHMLFESRWDSFERPVDLTLIRRKRVRRHGLKDFTGLIGVNAISADNGSTIMLQHMRNISMIFEQAKEIILVIGLDKIVGIQKDAVFIAKCMAFFGAEALPLALPSNERQDNTINGLPFMSFSKAADHIHMILLDNGRRRILRSENRDLLSCIGCRACTKVCPVSPYFAAGTFLSPREYLYQFISGQIVSVDKCLQCKSCEAVCPLNIDLPGMILEGNKRMSKKHRPISDRLLSNIDIVEGFGSNVPQLAATVSGNKLMRRLGEMFMGISMERRIPQLKRDTFLKRFSARKDKDFRRS